VIRTIAAQEHSNGKRVEFTCESCERFEFALSQSELSEAPYECRVCDELYIPEKQEVANYDALAVKIFQHVTPSKPDCPECGESFRRSNLIENFEEVLSMDSDKHPTAYQVSDAGTLSLMRCPSCEEKVDFK
jgi:hypothetical protein